jgi:hypothetical protein
MTMLSSQRLFSSECTGIFHFQLVAYYTALLRVSKKDIPKVVPNKTASFYRSLWDAGVTDPEHKDWLCLGFSFSADSGTETENP